MKPILPYFLFIFCLNIFCGQNNFAQDLVVLKFNDSLNCKILNDKNLKILEVAQYTNGIISIKKIELEQVISIQKEFYNKNFIGIAGCHDSIFTKDGDTILCKIISDKTDWFINFELPNNSRQSLTYASVNRIAKCENNAIKIPTASPNALYKFFEHSKNRVNVSFITNIRVGNLTTGGNKIARDHYNKLRLNFGFTGEYHRTISNSRRWLLGLHLEIYGKSAITSNASYTSNNSTIYAGDLNSDIFITNFGPNVIYKLSKKNKMHNYAIQYGFNFNFYKEQLTISNFTLNLSGSGVTQAFCFLYDYKMAKNFSFGTNLGIDLGSLSSLTFAEKDPNYNSTTTKNVFGKGETISLSQLKLAAGLRYWF